MSNKLIYYNTIPFLHKHSTVLDQIPGGQNFLKMTKFVQPSVGILDRTGTITIPFKHEINDPMPKFDPTFGLTYVECAIERMKELEQLHNSTGKKFRLLYSGGIDSTAIFASFVEYFGVDKTSKILEICCSPDSIYENPWTWDQHIRPNNFKLKSSHDHTNSWNDDVIVLMGEGNDQLFINIAFSKYKNHQNLYEDVTVDNVVDFLNNGNPLNDVTYCAKKLLSLAEAAYIPIKNMSMFVWWHHFNLNWSAVGHRVLSQASQDKFPVNFLNTSFKQFFQTTEFQKWSLKYHNDNPDSFASVENYKLDCKQLSIKSLNIPEYISKGKFNSFPVVHSMRPAACIIDSNLNMKYNPEDFLEFIEINNSFID